LSTGFVYDKSFLKHLTGPGHPECPERLLSTLSYIKDTAWYQDLSQLSAIKCDRSWIEEIHSSDYISRALKCCQSGAPYLDSVDVGVCKDSYDVALLAAGTPMVLADAIIRNEIKNGFALQRPPGHHAENDMALGFCLFNNIAILARYLRKQYGLDKIMIIDWDVHHGNGTQHSFEDDGSVLYISSHQYPFYPGTGAYSETGFGQGKDATLNCPMPAGSQDKDYELIFMEKILPKIDSFKPEFVLISAGFDAHREDPLAEISLSTDFFGWMTERIMEKADQYADGRIISILEGGYNLEVLPQCVEAHLTKLQGS
jgi:acetoin utilization deacetylase AcuC-like enzyme